MARRVEAVMETGKQCQPCLSRTVDVDGHVFCVDCQEILCINCENHHKHLKLTKNHNLISLEGTENNPRPTELIICTVCPVHQKEVELFCQEHKALCCITCATVGHRHCQVVVELKTKDATVESLQAVNMLEKYEQYLKIAKRTLEEKIVKGKDSADSITKDLESLKRNIDELMRRMISKVDALISKCKEKLPEVASELELHHDHVKKLIEKIQEAKSSAESVNKYGTNVQKFTFLHKLEEECKTYESLILEIPKTMVPFLEMKQNTNLLKIVEKRSLADVTVSTCCLDLPEPSFKLLQNCDFTCMKRVDLQAKLNSSNFRRPQVRGHMSLSKILIMKNDTIIIQEENLSSIFKFDSELNLETAKSIGQVVSIHEGSNGNIIACFQPDQIVQLSAGNLSLLETVKVKGPVSAHTPLKSGEILVKRGDAIFSVYNHRLEETRTIKGAACCHLASCMSKLTADINYSSIIYTCSSENEVFCIDFDGKFKFSYKHNQLHDPAGVALDREGNIYICGRLSSNIHRLSPSGTLNRIFTCSSLDKPSAIAFKENGVEFIVADSGNGSVHLMKIEN